jgi:hypothetical protein
VGGFIAFEQVRDPDRPVSWDDPDPTDPSGASDLPRGLGVDSCCAVVLTDRILFFENSFPNLLFPIFSLVCLTLAKAQGAILSKIYPGCT